MNKLEITLNYPVTVIAFKYVGREQKSDSLKILSNNGDNKESKEIKEIKESKETEKKKGSKDVRLMSNLPNDTAVHFGSFYGVEGNVNKPRTTKVKNSMDSINLSYKSIPRLEFTRQMVQKLERTAGTEDYARQVSALLEETVEPAHFKLHSLPTENSIPDGRYNPTGFPLWYKEPYKIPFASDEIYKLLKEKLDNMEGKARNIFEDESPEKSSLEEWSEDEQMEYGENDEDINDILKRRKSSMHLLSNKSSSLTEAKDTDSKESSEISLNGKLNKPTLPHQH
ncbi:hypothetical protein APICC_00183 [Apis cerana cerana]|uniref:Uncharacterized protein n=1 Tax=Apis cerana cerana TaxID=94128 RepID=A0A2A3EDJ9_APICC|nr:hypothetical protein APICC_00183 [Apis cerana cerana]